MIHVVATSTDSIFIFIYFTLVTNMGKWNFKIEDLNVNTTIILQ